MANTKKSTSKQSIGKHKSISPEGRERQMIALAEDLAEEKLRDGTASSQIVCHYLKLGTEREALEREKIQKENELLEAKKDTLETEQKREELYEAALRAFTTYSGGVQNDEEEL